MADLEYIKNDDLAELEKAIEHCSSLSMQNEKYYKQSMEQGDTVGMQYFANLYGEYNQIYQWLTELKETKRLLKAAVKQMAEVGDVCDCIHSQNCPLNECGKFTFHDEIMKFISN